jgi:DNA repair protein RecO (recombination protein O)
MRLSHVTPAIVLRAWPYGESDKIVTFLTEKYGKVTGIAKGAKRSIRRFSNSLEPFSLVNLQFQDRAHSELAFILASDLKESFQRLSVSLEKITLASYCVEITAGLIGEREESFLVFEHLKTGLAYLDKQDASLAFLICFQLKLLRLAGYQPSLHNCRRCGRNHRRGEPIGWYFSPRDGGILCQRCSASRKDTQPILGPTLDLMIDLQLDEDMRHFDRPVSSPALKEIRSAVMRFVRFHMEREIKSAPFLEQFYSKE